MGEVRLIEKIKGKIDRKSGNKIIGKLRVGAYCRVSTDNEDQLNSYASQLSYYKDKIANSLEWSLVDIYADGLGSKMFTKLNILKLKLMRMRCFKSLKYV